MAWATMGMSASGWRIATVNLFSVVKAKRTQYGAQDQESIVEHIEKKSRGYVDVIFFLLKLLGLLRKGPANFSLKPILLEERSCELSYWLIVLVLYIFESLQTYRMTFGYVWEKGCILFWIKISAGFFHPHIRRIFLSTQ
jgi:hypothetical protein